MVPKFTEALYTADAIKFFVPGILIAGEKCSAPLIPSVSEKPSAAVIPSASEES